MRSFTSRFPRHSPEHRGADPSRERQHNENPGSSGPIRTLFFGQVHNDATEQDFEAMFDKINLVGIRSFTYASI